MCEISGLVVYGLPAQGSAAPAIASAASATPGAIAPGGIATLYGTGLATGTMTASTFPLPQSLAGASVTVNGTAAPIFYASPSQINFQIPFEVSPGAAKVSVAVNGTAVGSVTVPLFGVAPGIFLLGQGSAAVVNQDGSINSSSQPANVGTTISAYVTGLGAVNPAIGSGTAAPISPLSNVPGATATIGGAAANVAFAGLAPGFAGLYQVNIQIPQLASGQYDLQVSVQGSGSNAASINVQ